MSTTVENLWAATQALPEPLLAEVLDFAEFVRLKHQKQQAAQPHASLTCQPAVSLADLQGGLEASATFAGDAVALQRQLRDEWQ